jgi:hypothetical protein
LSEVRENAETDKAVYHSIKLWPTVVNEVIVFPSCDDLKEIVQLPQQAEGEDFADKHPHGLKELTEPLTKELYEEDLGELNNEDKSEDEDVAKQSALNLHAQAEITKLQPALARKSDGM